MLGALALIAVFAFVVWRGTSRVVARATHEDSGLRFEVREFRDDPFPWNVLYGDNGLFHYRCEVHDRRGEVSAFSYFRGNSDGRAQGVAARWASPGQVIATFDNGLVVDCKLSVNSKASWSMK